MEKPGTPVRSWFKNFINAFSFLHEASYTMCDAFLFDACLEQ